MRRPIRRGAPKGLAIVLLSLAASLAASGAGAEDLQTEPTTKVLTPDPGSTTLTPTGPTGKPTSTAAGPTASATGTKGKGAPSVATGAPSGKGAPSASGSSGPPGSSEEPAEAPSVAPSASGSSGSSKPRAGKIAFERRSVSLGVADLAISFKAPADWPELAKDKLPEVPPNPDVTVSVERGFGFHEPNAKPADLREVVVVCGKGSAEYWADNIRDAAFTQMVSAAEAEAKKYSELSSIEPEAQRPAGDRIEQPFAAEAPLTSSKGKKGGETAKLQGLSFLGFYKDGSATNVVACSIACANVVEPGASGGGGDAGVCGDVIGSVEISGSFVPAPKRSWLAQIVFALKQNPTMMWLSIIGGVFLLLLAILIPVLIVRRKRARAHDDHHDHGEDHHDDHDDDHDHDDGYQEGYLAGLAAARARASDGAPGGDATDAIAALHASPPPEGGYFDPHSLARR
jgi:hypothetical protein